MLIKLHKGARHVISVCDTELIDTKITDSDGIRELDLTGSFFKGEEKNEKEIIAYLKDYKKEDASFNIVGEKSVECALRARIIDKDGIITIGDVPIALVLL